MLAIVIETAATKLHFTIFITSKTFRSSLDLTGKRQSVNQNSGGRLSQVSRLLQAQASKPSRRLDGKRDIFKIQSEKTALENAPIKEPSQFSIRWQSRRSPPSVFVSTPSPLKRPVLSVKNIKKTLSQGDAAVP
jgi:hypothetical protein